MEKSTGLKRWKIHRLLITKDNLWKLDMQDDIILSLFYKKNHRFNSQKPPRDFSYLLAASLHYIIKLLYNTHAFIDPVLNHRSTYFKIVGYFFSFHSIRSHGQNSFFCLWHHDFIKIESQIADIFQLDDDNTPV